MSFPPRPAAPTVARHVPTLTEVIEVQAQPVPAPEVDVVLPEPQPPHEGGWVDDRVPAIDVPELLLADAPLMQPFDAPMALPEAGPVGPQAQGAAAAPVLTEQDRAVLPRAVLRPSALAPSMLDSHPVAGAPAVAAAAAGSPSRLAADAEVRAIDEAQIVQRVHADLQRQIDGMLEYRLREAMAPVLARTTELLVRELRQELSKTMKDVVARAVAQEVARQRSRQGQ
jgi:hypothetical protein